MKYSVPWDVVNGDAFEDWVYQFFAPELTAAGMQVNMASKYFTKDRIGVDMEVFNGDVLVWSVQIKTRLAILRQRPLRQAANALLTCEVITPWCRGKMDALETMRVAEKFAIQLKASGLVDH